VCSCIHDVVRKHFPFTKTNHYMVCKSGTTYSVSGVARAEWMHGHLAGASLMQQSSSLFPIVLSSLYSCHVYTHLLLFTRTSMQHTIASRESRETTRKRLLMIVKCAVCSLCMVSGKTTYKCNNCTQKYHEACRTNSIESFCLEY